MTFDWRTLQDDWVDLLLSGQEAPAIERTRELLAEGLSPLSFFQNVITPALEEIGRRFEELEIFLPELAIAGETVQALSEAVVNPAMAAASQQRAHQGTVVLGTVQGDMHDIGKNMVGLMLGVHGFTVIDLGTNVAPAEFVKRAENEHADIIAMSALLMTTLPYMKDVVDRLVALQLRDKYHIIIGGAPTSPEVASQFGADVYGANAAEAVRICRELMAGQPVAAESEGVTES